MTNLADAYSKGVDATAVQTNIAGVGIELRSDRHRMAPAVDTKSEANMKIDDEWTLLSHKCREQ